MIKFLIVLFLCRAGFESSRCLFMCFVHVDEAWICTKAAAPQLAVHSSGSLSPCSSQLLVVLALLKFVFLFIAPR